MVQPKWLILLLILILGSQASDEGYNILDAMYDVAFFFPSTGFVLNKAIQIWSSANKVLQPPTEESSRRKLHKALAKLEKLSSEISNIQESIQHQILNLLPKEVDLDQKMNAVYANIGKVDYYFHRYLQYSDKSKLHRNDTINKFRDVVLDPSACGMQVHLPEIYRLLMDVDYGVDIIKLLANRDQTNSLRCKREESALHLISKLYNNVMLAELKGILMIHYAYRLGKQPNELIYMDTEVKEYLTDAWQRISRFIPRIKSYMKVADSEVWKCDPSSYIRGKTFLTIGTNTNTGNFGLEMPKKNRCFSLRDVTSDVSKNYVITGARILLRKNMFHIKIQQGLLVENGNIAQKTVHWKSIKSFSYNDTNVKIDKDYYHFDFGKTTINIDSLKLPYISGVLTGLRFAHEKQRLKLEIQMMTFDFNTGKLEEGALWISNDAEDSKRSEITFNFTDVPLSYNNLPMPKEKAFLDIRHVNYPGGVLPEGPYIVPFIDAQDISSRPATPLSGAGLGYRGARGSPGFLTLTTRTFGYEPHLRTDTDDEQALEKFLYKYDESLLDISDLELSEFGWRW